MSLFKLLTIICWILSCSSWQNQGLYFPLGVWDGLRGQGSQCCQIIHCTSETARGSPIWVLFSVITYRGTKIRRGNQVWSSIQKKEGKTNLHTSEHYVRLRRGRCLRAVYWRDEEEVSELNISVRVFVKKNPRRRQIKKNKTSVY